MHIKTATHQFQFCRVGINSESRPTKIGGVPIKFDGPESASNLHV